jgi:hypothetical protein
MTIGGRQQAIVTNFDETFWQEVLKEPADKLSAEMVENLV